MEQLISNSSLMITAIGFLAFTVSIITQVTKEIGPLNKIPTSLQVTILSIALTLATYIAYAQYAAIQLSWYMIAAAVVAGFFVAFITMFGWEKLKEIYTRFKQ